MEMYCNLDSGTIILDEFYAYCNICGDAFGKPKQVDRKGLRRHLRSSIHQQREAYRKKQSLLGANHALHVSVCLVFGLLFAYRLIQTDEQPGEISHSAHTYDHFNAPFDSSCSSSPTSAQPIPKPNEPQSHSCDSEHGNIIHEDGSEQVDDLFEASQEQGDALPGISGVSDSSESSDSDSSSDSGKIWRIFSIVFAHRPGSPHQSQNTSIHMS
jgi:hypothetical protein